MIPPRQLFALIAGLLLASAAQAEERITLSGQLDIQYDFVDADDRRQFLPAFGDPNNDNTDAYYLQPVPPLPDRSRLQIRRLRLGLDAALAGNWSLKLIGALDLAENDGPAPYADRRNYLDHAALHWRSAGSGDLRIGYGKLPFGIENLVPSAELPVIARSIATHYFTGVTAWGGAEGRPYGYVCTPLGLGARGNAVLWRGLWGSAHYHLAVSYGLLNPFGASGSSERQDWGIYAGLGHRGQGRGWSHDAGLNFAWRSEGIAYFPVSEQRFNELSAFNPYLKLQVGGLHFLGEYFHTIAENGQFIRGGFFDAAAPDRAAAAPTARAHGVNALLRYDFDAGASGPLSLVGRYAYLDSGGRGFRAAFLPMSFPARRSLWRPTISTRLMPSMGAWCIGAHWGRR